MRANKHRTNRACTYGLVLVFLCLLVVPSDVQIVAARQSSKMVLAYARIEYPLVVFRALTYDDLTEEQRNNASLLAEILDMYLTKEYTRQGLVAKQIHGYNANAKVLLYRNMKVIKSSDSEWQTALDNGWLLRDSQGNLISSTLWNTHYLADTVNQEYRDFVVGWLNNYFSLYEFDGVLADNCLIVSVDQWCYDCTGKPVNPRTGNLYTDEEICDDTISFINYVKSHIRSKLWISNGIFNGQAFFDRRNNFEKVLKEASLDGFISEGLFNEGGWDMGSARLYPEDKWKKSLDFVCWIQSNFLNQTGRLYVPSGRCAEGTIPLGYTPQQVATYIFSSLLLGITKSQNCLYLAAPLLDETRNLFKTDLGVPAGVYYIINGTHVYARDFTKIKVLVNPTDASYSVNLDGDYETIEGRIVSSIDMTPHSGCILKLR